MKQTKRKVLKKLRHLTKIPGNEARKLGLYDQIAQAHETSGRCVFCNLKEKYIIKRDSGVVLTVNLFPRSTGDLLIIPERHIINYKEVTVDEHLAKVRLEILAIDLLDKVLNIRAFYLLIREGRGTDKTVSHLHWQVMNYWKGLIAWHPQEDIKEPIKIAKKLKRALKEKK